MSAADVEVRALRVVLAGRTLVDGMTFRAGAGERWALLGANGRGKSTLLRVLAGLLAPGAGDVRYDGRPIAGMPPREAARQRALVEQQQVDAFSQSVREHVALSRSPYEHGWRLGAGEDPQVVAALQAMELEALAARDVRTLSGGERQRVAIAAALAQDTPVLLLDEPAAHLDPVRQHQVMDVLVRRPGRLLVMAMHEPDLALTYCTHVLVLTQQGWHAGPIDDLGRPGLLAGIYGGRPRLVELPGQGGEPPLRIVRWR